MLRALSYLAGAHPLGVPKKRGGDGSMTPSDMVWIELFVSSIMSLTYMICFYTLVKLCGGWLSALLAIQFKRLGLGNVSKTLVLCLSNV